MLKLIQHFVVKDDGSLPKIPDCLYAYVLAGNGVFLKAAREELDVLIPISRINIASLPTVAPYVHLSRRVPKEYLLEALELSRRNFPKEILFWFNLNDCWSMDIPQQFAQPSHVVPLDKTDARGTNALIDLHSHGALPSFFSRTDNRDEQGFRIYAVLGEVDRAPTIKVRAGVYGHYFYIRASTVFEMPDEILDVYEKEWRHNESAFE